MPVERRERVIAIWLGSTGNGRNPMFNGRRQPSRDGTSRMTREYQVRFCERLGVKFPGPTRQNLPLPHRNTDDRFAPTNRHYLMVTFEYQPLPRLTNRHSAAQSRISSISNFANPSPAQLSMEMGKLMDHLGGGRE